MITAHKILERIDPKQLTPANRLIALIFFSINLPGIILSIVFPLSLIIAFPGLILFLFYYRIYFKNEDIGTAKMTWKSTIYYNLALIAGFIGIAGLGSWPVLLYQAFAIAMAGIAYKDLLEFEESKTLESQNNKEKDEFHESMREEYFKKFA